MTAAALVSTGMFCAPAFSLAPARATGTGFCALTGYDTAHRFVWTGPSSGSWFDKANWNNGQGPDRVPGDAPGNPGSNNPTPALNAANADYVCIGSRAHVTIAPAKHVGLSALDIGQSATLRVSHGSMLYANARHPSRASHVRAGSRLTFSSATLGGVGTLRVGGQLDMTTWQNFESSQVSRWCDVKPCANTATEHGGQTVIVHGGEMDVDGVQAGGVAIQGRRTVENAGTIRLTNRGFLAPDDGTVIDNQTGGEIRIGNDRGIWEGVVNPDPDVGPPLLMNAGLIVKTAGSGNALIGARYESHRGSIRVRTGSLTLAGGGTIPNARVAPGASWGTTACTGSTCTATQTSGKHPRVATVQLPVTSHGSSVSIALTRASSGSKAFGGPVSIGAPDATSTGAHPTRVDLRYDDSIVPDHPGALHVYRLGKNSARIGVPRCLSSGAVPKGHSACVVRARCLGASAGNDTTTCGGVDVGVNTYQPFSRWIAT